MNRLVIEYIEPGYPPYRMILLSNSIPKSGSTHLANLQEDILSHCNVKSGQRTLRDYFQGRYIPKPSIPVLYNLRRINQQKGSIIVKCHWAFSQKLDLFCRHTDTKMTMTYRDPRDIILSMIDHGKRTRESNDPSGPFSDVHNVVDSLPVMIKMMEGLQLWQRKAYMHFIKYEDFISDKFTTLKEMISFLGWELNDNDLRKIIESHEKSKKTSHNFNKGTTERWRDEMNDFEKEICLKAFESHLIRLNYSLT